MATESERCVDELLEKQAIVEQLLARYESENTNDLVIEARNILTKTQIFIDNHRSIIPSYSLKKVTDALRKLENCINKPKRSKFQFKSKVESPNIQAAQKLENDKACDKETISVVEAFGFRDEVNKILSLEGEKVNSKDVSLINLDQCDVKIYGHANTVYIRNITNTTVTVILACRAITITNCKNCRFKLVCQQLRIDSTNSSQFEIFTSARSMFESSGELVFSSINFDTIDGINFNEIKELLARANFNELQNNWKCIDDFDWLCPNTESSNYKIIEP